MCELAFDLMKVQFIKTSTTCVAIVGELMDQVWLCGHIYDTPYCQFSVLSVFYQSVQSGP